MPDTFGRYELRGLVGRGGMGEVFRAFDTVRHREVALKLLPAHLAGDTEFQERFRRESQIAARLSAPHVIPIHDFGEIDGRLFIDMRLVQGDDLAAVLRRVGRLSPDVAVEIIGQIASALDAAHAGGLVHRDVKPSNVLVTELGAGGRPFAYLVDFGLARPMAQDESELTRTGAVGTLPYLAPERINGDPGDRRADVYALACVLFELLVGRKPWDGSMYDVLSGHLKSPPPRPSVEVPGIPPALDGVIAVGMAKPPEDRYSSAGDLARAARAALTVRRPPMDGTWRDPAATSIHPQLVRPEPPIPTPRRRGPLVAAVALVVALLAVVLGVVVLHDNGSSIATPSTPSPTSTPTATPTSPTPSPSPTTLHSGSGATVSWSDFTSFSKLVGTKPKDTANSFQNLTCTLSPPQSGDPTGLAESVFCNESGFAIDVFVGRFSTAAQARTYANALLIEQNSPVYAWGEAGVPRGLEYYTPGATAADADALDTLICGLPTYVVRILVNDSALKGVDARNQLLGGATFPDVVPPRCNDGFSGPAKGAAIGGPSQPGKPVVPFGPLQVDALLTRDTNSSKLGAGSASGSSGVEAVRFDQSGHVSFWTAGKDGLRRTGIGTYPIAARDGYFDEVVGVQFAGMAHVSFIFQGLFVKPGRRQYLVFAYGASGWGVVTPQGRTKLVVAKFPPTRPAVFDDVNYPTLTQLVTTTGSAKTAWNWTGASFVPVR